MLLCFKYKINFLVGNVMKTQKRKMPLVSIVLFVIGTLFVLVGVIYPNFKFGEKNTFSYNMEKDIANEKIKFDVSVKTKETLDTNNVYLVVKGEEFKLILKNGSGKEYEFSNTIYGWEYVSITQAEKISVKAKTVGGSEIVFTAQNKVNESAKSFLMITFIGVGLFIIFGGFVAMVVIRGARAAGGAIKRVAYGDGQKSVGILGAIEERIKGASKGPELKKCEYCESLNDPKNSKCMDCGAPLNEN